MPRRYVDYPDALQPYHVVATWGAFLFAAGVIWFLGINAYALFIRRERAADNPWGVGATTLEWTLSSPPPFHQFETLPHIK